MERTVFIASTFVKSSLDRYLRITSNINWTPKRFLKNFLSFLTNDCRNWMCPVNIKRIILIEETKDYIPGLTADTRKNETRATKNGRWDSTHRKIWEKSHPPSAEHGKFTLRLNSFIRGRMPRQEMQVTRKNNSKENVSFPTLSSIHIISIYLAALQNCI